MAAPGSQRLRERDLGGRSADGGANLRRKVEAGENVRALTQKLEVRGGSSNNRCHCTVLVLRMANRKWKEFKQQPSMLPGSAVPGSCLVSFYILWAILSTSTVINLN